MSALVTGADPVPVGVRQQVLELAPALAVFAWIGLGLGGETMVGIGGQRALGLLTWVLLLALLSRESPRTRAQVAVVVIFATLVEYCFAGWLGVYVYRLHNVPAFVPPGHGLVYLAALCIGRSALARAARRPLVVGTVVAGGLWALWFLCLLAFLVGGRQPLVYVGAFLVVSTLELLGTALGTWTWSPVDPIMGWVSMGNPPSGAAGGYGWFDAAGSALAPVVVRAFTRRRT
jgi:hypothetical protein